MATQSDNNPQNPASGTEQEKAEVVEQPDDKKEAVKPPSSASVFVNSEPMREEQVQNAVKFLSHPKVRGSPVIYRRSFLEKKGLTKEEIDEAFRRVPDPQPSAQPASTNQADGQIGSSSNAQPQVAPQTMQPAPVAPIGVVSKRYQFHWSHAVYGIAILAASGAGTGLLVKNTIVPRLKSWIRKVVQEEDNETLKEPNLKPSPAEEAAAAAKAAAAAAADVAKASQEMLNSRNQEKRYLEEFMNVLDVQVQEMRSMSNSIRKLEGQTNSYGRVTPIDQEYNKVSVSNTRQPYVNGRSEYDMRPVRSSSPPPPSVEPSAAPHPKSYMEIMAMVQRGERPPNIRDIDDSPPNPNQQLSNPRLAPKAKPWELGQAQSSSVQVLQSQSSSEDIYAKMRENSLLHQSNGDGSVPWQRQIGAKVAEIDYHEEQNARTFVTPSEQPIPRKWVPPQPPPVAMAEAAEAIRRPKQPVRKDQLTDDELISRTTRAPDELQRITKISETGGIVEINGGNSELNTHEVPEEQDLSNEGN